MDGHNIVAVYNSRDIAERARDRLIGIGIPASDIRMSVAEPDIVGEVGATRRHEPGFWDWLFGRDVPEDDRSWYQSNLREGRTALSVFVVDAQHEQQVSNVLEEYDPIEFPEAEAAGYERRNRYAEPLDSEGRPIARPATPPLETVNPPVPEPLSPGVEHRAGDRGLGSPETWSRRGTLSSIEPAAGAPIATTRVAGQPDVSAASEYEAEQAGIETGTEQVIPIVKEELNVGKRASERRYRIRTYIVETPVEKDVTLRDERVVVEHRPVTGAAGLHAEMPSEREYEVIERHEEPVVEKRARNVEEVVVRRDVDERTEKLRDTVRQTHVDVEDEAGSRTTDLERAGPLDRGMPEEQKP